MAILPKLVYTFSTISMKNPGYFFFFAEIDM